MLLLLLQIWLSALPTSVPISVILLATQTEQFKLALLLLLKNTWRIQVLRRGVRLANRRQNDLLGHLDDMVSVDSGF